MGAYSRLGAYFNVFCLWDGFLFEVGANSRLGAYLNKYGMRANNYGELPDWDGFTDPSVVKLPVYQRNVKFIRHINNGQHVHSPFQKVFKNRILSALVKHLE